MGSPRHYDIYNMRNELIFSNATARDIAEQLGTTPENVHAQFVSGNRLLGQYSVFLAGTDGGTRYTEAELISKFGSRSLAEWRTMNRKYGKGGK